MGGSEDGKAFSILITDGEGSMRKSGRSFEVDKAAGEAVAARDHGLYGPDEIASTLADIVSVGPDKPMGYLPVIHLERCGWSVDDALALARDRGLSARWFPPEECSSGSSVYVWDPARLREFLVLNRAIVERAAWPSEPSRFVAMVANVTVTDRALYEFVGVLFADHRMREPRHVRVPDGFVPWERPAEVDGSSPPSDPSGPSRPKI